MALAASGNMSIGTNLFGPTRCIRYEILGSYGAYSLSQANAATGQGLAISDYYGYSHVVAYSHQVLDITAEDYLGCDVYISVPPDNVWSPDAVLDCSSFLYTDEAMTTHLATGTYVIGDIGDEGDPIADFTWLEYDSGPGDCDYCP